MAGRQAAHTRIGVSNGIEDWMTRRNADVQRLKHEAEAAGREAWEPLPKSISESAFNVLKPSNISQGAFYELHNGVDKSFHGARIGAKGGGGSWSAKRLGLPKYGTAKRLWYGAPGPLKAVIGGAATEAAAEAYDHFDEERSQ